jgi:hypothetical protein
MNNSLSLQDPLGLDCIYLNYSENAVQIDPGECGPNDNGYYVDGTVTGIATNSDGTIFGVVVDNGSDLVPVGSSLPGSSPPDTSLDDTCLGQIIDSGNGRVFSSASDLVTAGAIYTAAGITVVVAAPVATAGLVVVSEAASPYAETWYGRMAWRWAYGKQYYAAPVLGTAWKAIKWAVKDAQSTAAASSANGGKVEHDRESLRCALHSRDSRFLVQNVSSQTVMDQHFAQCPTASAPPSIRSRTECSSDIGTRWQQRRSKS